MFVLLIHISIARQTLVICEICITVNCAIHMQGNSVGLQEALFELYVVAMTTLSPYHPDFNPTKLVMVLF